MKISHETVTITNFHKKVSYLECTRINKDFNLHLNVVIPICIKQIHHP